MPLRTYSCNIRKRTIDINRDQAFSRLQPSEESMSAKSSTTTANRVNCLILSRKIAVHPSVFFMIIFLALNVFFIQDIYCSNYPEKHESLYSMAVLQFPKESISRCEEKLLESAQQGTKADCLSFGKIENKNTLNFNTIEQRKIRPKLIEWLCRDPKARKKIPETGLQVKGALIFGSIDLQYLNLQFPLIIQNSSIYEDFFLKDSRLTGLNLKGTHVRNIFASNINISGDIILTENFTSNAIYLNGAEIGNNLICTKGNFLNAGDDSFQASDITVKGNVFFRKIKSEGDFSISGAVINGNLECTDGSFSNESATSLNARNIIVKGDISLNGVRSNGEICFSGATIGGNLECKYAILLNINNTSLSLESANIKGIVFFNNLHAEGILDLISTTIQQQLYYHNVNTENITLNLGHARIGTIDDDTNWPQHGNLILHGLIYDGLSNFNTVSKENRLDWLRRQDHLDRTRRKENYSPQPYEQLAGLYKKYGYETEAIEVEIEKNKALLESGRLTRGDSFFLQFLGFTVAYGYKPWRPLWGAAFFILFGYGLFAWGYRKGLITPTTEKDETNKNHPKFSAFMYSVDMFVPIINFYMRSYWLPNANRHSTLNIYFKTYYISGAWLRIYLWLHIIVGWVISTLFVLGMAGLIKK
jgi:hypothetical protein